MLKRLEWVKEEIGRMQFKVVIRCCGRRSACNVRISRRITLVEFGGIGFAGGEFRWLARSKGASNIKAVPATTPAIHQILPCGSTDTQKR